MSNPQQNSQVEFGLNAAQREEVDESACIITNANQVRDEERPGGR
jgi:hypothetical protein